MDTIEKDNNPQHQDMTDTSTIDATEAAGEKKKSPRKIVFILAVVAVLVVVGIVGGVILSGMQVISIRAEYTGPLSAGTVLDNANSNIIIIGRTKNGDNVTIAQGDWGISSPKTLEADKTAVVRIAYNDLFCELTVNCEDSNVASITAYYDGELKAGTVISNITDGLHVMATYKNGTNTDVTNQCAIENGPITLEADKTTVIKVSYVDPVNNKRFTTEFSVSCTTKTVRKIIVKYVGSADAGEILDENNEWIIVTAMYQNGDSENVTGWTVKEPATLENSQIASVYVSYEGFTEKLTVECKTIDPDTYRKNCLKVNYNDLARSPEEYENKMVTISGKISYINSNANTSSGYIYKIDAGQRKYLNVAFNGKLDSGNLIENDYITCYGEFIGIVDVNYDDLPLINAKYIDRRY
ncbi:MAG: hypothetical protein U0N82_09195 [Oscillospiraceae bacterium]